jgi:hypothetical protein
MMEEKDEFMDAINSLKAAVSGIEKQYTMQKGVKIDGQQDGNIGAANEQGDVDFSKFENLSKKKKLFSAMSEE